MSHEEPGFEYSVSDEQIREHQQRSPAQICKWLEETNRFLYKVQTPEERKRMMLMRGDTLRAAFDPRVMSYEDWMKNHAQAYWDSLSE